MIFVCNQESIKKTSDKILLHTAEIKNNSGIVHLHWDSIMTHSCRANQTEFEFNYEQKIFHEIVVWLCNIEQYYILNKINEAILVKYNEEREHMRKLVKTSEKRYG